MCLYVSQAHWATFMSNTVYPLCEPLRYLEKDDQLKGLVADHKDLMTRTGHDHRYAYTD